MKKPFFFILSFIYLGAQITVPASFAESIFVPPITAPTALLLDNTTNQIVFAKTPNLRRAPASTTKLLTAIVALNLKDSNQTVTIPKYAEAMPPSKIHVHRGEHYRLGDLIQAMLVNSANDAAAAIAIITAGSFQNFAAQMNATARALGAEHSNFVNPSGLPDSRQYSTVYDMALIMREAQRYPLIVRALKTKTGMIRTSRGRKIYLKNHNKMLWRDRREVLGKTGWTQAARHCFVGEIRASGRSVVVAMLGSQRLWRDLKTLVDFQFKRFGFSVPSDQKVKEGNMRQIQTALRRAGYYNGPVNGRVTRTTVVSIRKFQRKNGIRATGHVGPQTWSVLKHYL